MSEHTLTEVVLPGVVAPEGLIVRSGAVPAPRRGQVLLELLATGVSFAEKGMRRNRYPGQPKFPFVPGYDLVGRVAATGADVDRAWLGQRVAAAIKVGGWSTHVLVDARSLVAVPDSIDDADAEALVVNGITAWQMLHRSARVHSGDTILVHGASGGVGLVLVQLARHAGVRVIGTASPRHHALLADLGAEALDYADPALVSGVRALAPVGVDAVFDNLGGPSFARSFALLAPKGTLVGYGMAGQLEDDNNLPLAFAGVLTRFAAWTIAPNHGRRATFYNFWGGKIVRSARFHRDQADDLRQVFDLVEEGVVTVQIAARFPLSRAGEALAFAEARTKPGKVILVPDLRDER